MKSKKLILPFEEVGIKDVSLVGGKNASLGEMIRTLKSKGVPVPSGFVVTATAYFYFLKKTGLDKFIKETLQGLKTKNLKELHERGSAIRYAIMHAKLPKDLSAEVVRSYREMEKHYGKNVDVAVRSSATAEDLPGASFAGEQESYLGIRGAEEVVAAVRATMASLFTDRAISYRADRHFDHLKIALSVGVQKMVRSDRASSGVMFTLDTESGFPDVVLINGSWGLGEMIVKGEVTPDEWFVWKKGLDTGVPHPIIEKKLGVKLQKMIYHAGQAIQQTKIVPTSPVERARFVLTDKEVSQLAQWGMIIEKHYSDHYKKWTPMDMEWAKDGITGELFIVQARPETVHANQDYSKIKEYRLQEVGSRKQEARIIVTGASVGSRIATGKARVILDAKRIRDFKKGEVLVTTMTDPDWEPIMKIASAIVTDKGGRTSHAAIVSRELGIPAVVGTENATKFIKTGDPVTVDTTGSAGNVYRGFMKFKVIEHDLKKIPHPKTKVMVNVAMPDTAFETSFLPNSGVGLAREEFIIASKIGIHPLALLNLSKQKPAVRREIAGKMSGWRDQKKYYIDNLAFGIAKIGVAFYPRPVIVRFSDFKTNEYRTLLGGEAYEPKEENPMIGWRGASRYYDPKFKPAFMMEAAAVKIVREEMGLTNVIPMVPFCRTVEEGIKTQEAMAEVGLVTRYVEKGVRNKDKSRAITPIYVMCEIPSNVILANEFLEIFDGMSIGSNDLTQLTLGLDRDSGIVSKVANEKNPAIKKLIADVIKICKAKRKYIGICGQGPSDYPDFAEFLVEAGIDSMSLNPDTVVKTTVAIAKKEKQVRK
ncbi:MAG: phosphoenolpyruvate synthase [Patescibacteria group bacterium]|nr:phosphoenolpyruvate synthase [Patescibacteria group bacterium]MDE2015471.1 phosphoenolpyruvate synthase [Patescibacteria group bacterium]MDE2226913.1 phosphoenolpyruvate synthase [Patescibacteria group bacterium]